MSASVQPTMTGLPGGRPSPTFNSTFDIDNANGTSSLATQQTSHGPQSRFARQQLHVRPVKSSPTWPTSSSAIRTTNMSTAELDKRRNKLGYRRISIACVHCRRRKIRCIPAEGDPQERCQTCIRLKKDCVFHPVDPQMMSENDVQPSTFTGVDNGGSSTVSSSSPGAISEGTADERRDSSGFVSLRSSVPRHFQGVPVEPNHQLPVQDPAFGSEYGYAMRDPMRRSWDDAAYGQPPMRGTMRPLDEGASDRSDSYVLNSPTSMYNPLHQNELPTAAPPLQYNSTYPAPNVAMYAYQGGDTGGGDGGMMSLQQHGIRSASHGPMDPSSPLDPYQPSYQYDAMNHYPHLGYPPHSLAVQNAPPVAVANGNRALPPAMPIGLPQQHFAARSYSLPHTYKGSPDLASPSYSDHHAWGRPRVPHFNEEQMMIDEHV